MLYTKCLRKLLRRRVVKIQKSFQGGIIRCGNDYGGFDIIPELLKRNGDLVVYSFGIGEDLSFSEDIDRNFDAQIFAFDPTPKAIRFVKDHPLYQKANFHFIEKGIASKDCHSRFYLPENEEYVSGSCIQHEGLSSDSIEVELCKLKSFMGEFGHNEIDILKMDIEGSEFDVIEDILKDEILFTQLCVEVHDYYFRDGNRKLKALIRILNEYGYLIGSIKGENEITFIKAKQ